MISFIQIHTVINPEGYVYGTRYRLIKRFPNDYFFDKMTDILEPENWLSFISVYNKYHKLPIMDKEGNYYCYAVKIQGVSRELRMLLEDKHGESFFRTPVFYIFPFHQVGLPKKSNGILDMKDIFIYNKKHVWKLLR